MNACFAAHKQKNDRTEISLQIFRFEINNTYI